MTRADRMLAVLIDNCTVVHQGVLWWLDTPVGQIGPYVKRVVPRRIDEFDAVTALGECYGLSHAAIAEIWEAAEQTKNLRARVRRAWTRGPGSVSS